MCSRWDLGNHARELLNITTIAKLIRSAKERNSRVLLHCLLQIFILFLIQIIRPIGTIKSKYIVTLLSFFVGWNLNLRRKSRISHICTCFFILQSLLLNSTLFFSFFSFLYFSFVSFLPLVHFTLSSSSSYLFYLFLLFFLLSSLINSLLFLSSPALPFSPSPSLNCLRFLSRFYTNESLIVSWPTGARLRLNSFHRALRNRAKKRHEREWWYEKRERKHSKIYIEIGLNWEVAVIYKYRYYIVALLFLLKQSFYFKTLLASHDNQRSVGID